MLTRQHVLARYEPETGRIVPDRLTRRSHAQYAAYAERMLRAYRNGVGRTRRELHRAVEAVFANEPECPVRRIGAFCKLLDDASVFRRDRKGAAAQLRRNVFRRAAARHPLVAEADRLFESEQCRVKTEIAEELGLAWPVIERELFADVIEFQRLEKFPGYADGSELLARYNVAQVQGALYRATSLKVWAEDDLKTIVRYAKLARLMHTLRRLDAGGWLFHFDGPASVLRRTRRYGVAMARFLPALIACRRWRMQAVVAGRSSGWNWRLELSDADGLKSHLPPPQEFDSSAEEIFFQRWGAAPREGWTLRREGELLFRGQKVFTPDFVFDHQDGRRAFLEIVGFWTPEYLEAKINTLREFAEAPILVAVADQVGTRAPDLVEYAIPYRTAPKVEDVLARLQALLQRR
jgi:predicted nuclease of restriction endonuclease-like RecB superfamily